MQASALEKIPAGRLVMGFPVREALAVPFKVQTDDKGRDYAELEKLLNRRLKAVDAQLPTQNQNYDPDAAPQQGRRNSRKRN